MVLTWENPGNAGITGYEVRYEVSTSALPETWDAIEGSDGNTTSHEITGLTNGTRYTLEVRAVNAAEPGTASRVTARVGALLSPANLTVSAGAGSLTLSWDDPGYPGIGRYEVRYVESASPLPERWTAIAGSDGSTTRHEVTGLTNGTRYAMEVRAANPAGPGAPAGLTAAPGVPSAPEDLRWLQEQGVLVLTWRDADNAAITGYQVRYGVGAVWNPDWTDVPSSGATTTRFAVPRLANVTLYTFEVRAVSAAGPGASAGVMPMTPKAPGMLRASPGVNEVTLTWSDPRDPSIDGYAYHYFSGVRPQDPDWTAIPGSGAGTTSHTVTGLTNGTSYTFEVRARNTAGAGPPADATATPYPGAPADLEAAAGVGEVRLNWTDPGDAAVTAYQLLYYSGVRPPQPSWNEIPGSGAGTTDHVVTGLTNGTTYTFELRPTAGAAAGDSSVATATPYPAAPAGLETTAGVNEVRLDWGDPGDAAITAYQLIHYGGVRPPRPSWDEIPGSGAGTTDHVVTGLTNGTTYTFELRPTAGAAAGDSSVATATPYPAAPVNLEATAGDSTVTLAWSDPGDAAITAYQLIYYGGVRPPRPSWDEIPGSGAGTTDHAVTGLTNRTAYTFELRATAGAVHGDTSVVEATPRACPALVVGGLNDTTVTLGQAVEMQAAVSGGEGTYAYALSVDPASGSEISVDEQEGTITGTPSSAGAYAVTVSVTDAHGCVGTFTFTVQVCPDVSVAAIEDVTVTMGDSVSITARATGGCGAITYTMTGAPPGVGIETVTENGQSVGQISGAPGGPAREYEVAVTATDAAGNTGEEGFTVTVVCPEITVGGLRDTSVTVGQSVSMTAAGSGSEASYWYFISSEPAEGITLSIGERDGAVTVTAAAAGTYTVTVRVRDDHGCSGRGTFAMKVCTVITVTQSQPPVRVRAGATATVTVSAAGGCGDKTFSGPSGLDWVEKTGSNEYTVAPPSGTAPRDYTFQVTATDAEENTGTGTITFTVIPPPPLGIMCSADTTLTVGGSIKRTASAWEGVAPYTFLPLSVKPSGLSLTLSATGRDGEKGTVTGEAARVGVYRVTVTVRDHDGASESCGFNVTVRRRPCPTIEVSAGGNMTVKAGSSIRRTATATGSGGSHGFSLSVTPSSGQDLSIGGTNGEISGNVLQAGTYTVTVYARATGASSHCTPGSDSFTITVLDGPGLTCPANQTVKPGASISVMPTVSGGTTPYTWSISQSSGLDLSISSSGTITGTAPSTPGTYTVTVTVTDNNDITASCTFTIKVLDEPELTCPANQTVKPGASISVTPTVSGGTTPYTWSISQSSGLDLSISSSGTITGTAPSTPGTYTVTVTVTDDNDCEDTCTLKITVLDEPELTCPSNQTVKPGASISVTPTVSGGTTPYTWSISQSSGLDLSISSSGTITGTAPSTPGTYTVTVTVTDDNDCEDTCTLKITVSCPTITVSGLSDEEVTKNSEIPSMTATASGGRSPYTFTMSGAPGSVEIDPSTGVVSGNVGGETRTYLVTVKATDAGGCWGTATFNNVVEPPLLELADIPDVDADVNKAISSITPSVSGGKEPYTFSVSGKPAGISFSTSTGVISGTPRGTGTSTVTVTVTDANDKTDTDSFKLYVSNELSIMSISNVVVTWQLDMDPIQVSASGGRGSYTYSLESPPAGISISSSGRIGGTPTQLGSATVTVIVRDKGRRQEEESFTMTVALPGDFNGDGTRDAADAKLFNRMMGLRRSDAGYDRRMDLNGDGTINYADFVILTGYIESDASSQSDSGS